MKKHHITKHKISLEKDQHYGDYHLLIDGVDIGCFDPRRGLLKLYPSSAPGLPGIKFSVGGCGGNTVYTFKVP